MTRSSDPEAVECRSASSVVRIVPASGAKVTSLYHVPTGREWLTGKPAAGTPEGGVYGAAAYGWDECFPSIAPDERLPDHGELWSRPWQLVDAAPGRAETEVAGSSLPYRFRRRVEVDGDDVVVSYEVENVGTDAFDAFWAMHPLLAVEPGARILLPGVAGAAVVDSASAAAVAVDGRVAWPVTRAADGSAVDLATYGGRPGLALKLVVERAPRRVAVACGGSWLGFEMETDVVPHLGVWLNEGGWPEGPIRLRHVALEPTSGLADDLGETVARGSGWRIESGGARRWRVRLRLGAGEKGLREWLDSA